MSENKEIGTNVDKTLGWMEKISNFIHKNGFTNIILTIMVFFLVLVVSQAAFNPGFFIKKIEEVQNKQHTESIVKRLEATPYIRENIVNLRSCTSADRVFILETHNGGSNLANLPFLYVDLSYAEPSNTSAWLEDEYKNVRLSRYPWASYLYEHSYWFGNINNMKNIDPELFYRLEKEGVKYMGAIIMYGKYNPSGVLGVVYTDEDIPSELVIKQNLVKYSSILSGLLNNDN